MHFVDLKENALEMVLSAICVVKSITKSLPFAERKKQKLQERETKVNNFYARWKFLTGKFFYFGEKMSKFDAATTHNTIGKSRRRIYIVLTAFFLFLIYHSSLSHSVFKRGKDQAALAGLVDGSLIQGTPVDGSQ